MYSPPAPTTPDLVLAVIARDESRCIARCLQSARPFVDRMLVLDTGSVDETPAIARACGAEVHHAVWPDDFAAARNLALQLADADWSLKHPAQAQQQGLPMAELAWQRCLEIGERPDLEGSVAGRGSILAEHNLTVIRGA